MDAQDFVRELGEPHELCGLEDHIVAKFEKPWLPCQPSQLPANLRLSDGGRCVTATAETLVANYGLLSERRVVAAAFAGCAAFGSSEGLASAARKVLARAETLVIVHNRDQVIDLVEWFPSVDVLVLHHDLKYHTAPPGWEGMRGNVRPQLKRLIGSAEAMGMQSLLMAPETVCALVSCCPQLYEVQTAVHDLVDPPDPALGVLQAHNPLLLTSATLILGSSFERYDGGSTCDSFGDVTSKHVMRASELFPSTRRLEVTTWRLDSITHMRRFPNVTDFTLCYEEATPVRFPRLLEDVLMQLRLKTLSLKSVSDVSLNDIARNWPDLQSLSLFDCSIAFDGPGISTGCFESLLSLRFWLGSDEKHDRGAMNELLEAATKLATLRLDGAVMCALFLDRCREHPLPSLQRLTLATHENLSALKVTCGDLRCLVDALPSLQYAATDS